MEPTASQSIRGLNQIGGKKVAEKIQSRDNINLRLTQELCDKLVSISLFLSFFFFPDALFGRRRRNWIGIEVNYYIVVGRDFSRCVSHAGGGMWQSASRSCTFINYGKGVKANSKVKVGANFYSPRRNYEERKSFSRL